ncbi:hypothetical protein ACJX0J_008103 [Zea mays]
MTNFVNFCILHHGTTFSDDKKVIANSAYEEWYAIDQQSHVSKGMDFFMMACDNDPKKQINNKPGVCGKSLAIPHIDKTVAKRILQLKLLKLDRAPILSLGVQESMSLHRDQLLGIDFESKIKFCVKYRGVGATELASWKQLVSTEYLLPPKADQQHIRITANIHKSCKHTAAKILRKIQYTCNWQLHYKGEKKEHNFRLGFSAWLYIKKRIKNDL